MGRTARFDQVYVSSLDADPVEQDVLTTVKSIITSEIEVDTITADKIAISNTNPTKDISIGSNIFVDNTATNIVVDITKGLRSERVYVNDKLGIGAPNATNEFQVGPNNELTIDRENIHLFNAKGNVIANNVLARSTMSLGTKFKVSDTDSNVLKVVGNTYSTNVTVHDHLLVGNDSRNGSNVAVFQGGNVVISGDQLIINGNLQVNGNAFVSEIAQYQTTVNLVVQDAFIQMANTNTGGNFDNAIIMTEEKDGSEANLAIGYQFSNNEFVFGRTFAAPPDTSLIIDESNTVNLHVYGQFYTDGNVGVANTTTDYTLSIGSNVYFDDTGSNVMFSRGNVFTERLLVGTGGVSIGDRITVNESADSILTVDSNIQSYGVRTTGTTQSGISNTAPTDTLSIGAKIFANLTTANTLTIVGNTTTTNLFTGSIYSHSNVVIHADRFGGDSATDALVLKSGPTASNVSSIEISGASTSNTNQIIRFSTKNKERMRITPEGKIGIANTNPTEELTLAGNVHLIGSNAVVYGNTWGSKGMRMYSEPSVGQNRIENIVAEGKGLNFYASQNSTMGTPKLTILETSNVGIGTATPKGRLHTSGGTVFINDEITNTGTYKHLGTPLIVSNSTPITNTTDFERVLELCREGGVASSDGVRACFKMGKHTAVSSGTAHSQLDLCLATTNYETETDVLSLRSDGRIGVGTTVPTAHLEIHATGAANPTTNGLLVHNFDGDSGDAILAGKTRQLAGNIFTSYIQTNAGNDPRGWSTGVTGSGSDFRITQNVDNNKDSATVGVYISGTNGDVGIATDVPRGKLDVSGNVVVGAQLSFNGLAGDEFGNTMIIERRYNVGQSKNELVLFKGNDATAVDAGPDRIRHIAGEHVFQTYTSSGETFYGSNQILEDMDGQTDKPLVVCDNQIVVVGGQRSDADSRGANTKLVVNGDIEFGGGGAFRLTGFAFSTTTSDPSINIIRNILDGSTRRPLTFVHEIDDNNDSEFARFDTGGNLGIGTSVVDSNVHIYSGETTDINVLKLESPGTNKETGMLIYTGEGEGGYLKGFSDSVNGTTGLIVGVANNSTLTNCIHVIHSSNVGVGTALPGQKFHVYDGMARVESASSNATIELTTTAGSSNIYSDTTGNVHINSISNAPTIFLDSNVEVVGNFAVDGALDLGNQVAIGLDGATANTELHVNGGIITNSDQVSTKKYSNTFPLDFGDGQDIQLTFRPGTFYAKVVAVLRETSDVRNTSTMILELSGGTHDGTTASMYDIAVGTKNLFGATNAYPWSATATAGTRSIDIRPVEIDSTQNYIYDISVEVTSACDGGLVKISHNINDINTDLDNGVAGQQTLAVFTY